MDRNYWGGGDVRVPGAAPHELTHGLGAVQWSAPHATEPGHCTDSLDIMCYADVTVFPCLQEWDYLFLDCRGDDYFRLSPPAGSYLARHWNVARSSFVNRRARSDPVV